MVTNGTREHTHMSPQRHRTLILLMRIKLGRMRKITDIAVFIQILFASANGKIYRKFYVENAPWRKNHALFISAYSIFRCLKAEKEMPFFKSMTSRHTLNMKYINTMKLTINWTDPKIVWAVHRARVHFVVIAIKEEYSATMNEIAPHCHYSRAFLIHYIQSQHRYGQM